LVNGTSAQDRLFSATVSQKILEMCTSTLIKVGYKNQGL